MPLSASSLVRAHHAPASRKTYHHSSHQQKNDSDSDSFDNLPPLAADATIEEHLEQQLKSGLVQHIYFHKGSNDSLKQFCNDFSTSPIPLGKKIEFINELIALRGYDNHRMCTLISELPAACNSLIDFTELILPLFNQHHDSFQKSTLLLRDLVTKVTHTLLHKLEPHEFFELLEHSLNNRTVLELIYHLNSINGNKAELFITLNRIIQHCDQQQLDAALEIINNDLDHPKRGDEFHPYDNFLLSSLHWILRKSEKPTETFDILKKCPIYSHRQYQSIYINTCLTACAAGTPIKDIRTLISKLFIPLQKSHEIRFESIPDSEKGKYLFQLINHDLLPSDFKLSNAYKDFVFDYIMTKMPPESRRKIAIELYYHADTRLNRYLWPAEINGVFASLFYHKAKLPARWKEELKQFISDDDSLTNHRRPGN